MSRWYGHVFEVFHVTERALWRRIKHLGSPFNFSTISKQYRPNTGLAHSVLIFFISLVLLFGEPPPFPMCLCVEQVDTGDLLRLSPHVRRFLKVLSLRESTWHGPSQGGWSGLCTRSHRRKTWEHVFRKRQVAVDGRLLLCWGRRRYLSWRHRP